MSSPALRHRRRQLSLVLSGAVLVLTATFWSWSSASSLAWTLLVLAIGLWVVMVARTLLREVERLRRTLTDAAEAQLALTQIRPILGALPVPFGGWAVQPVFALRIVESIVARRPKVIFECGSGSSTILIAETLRHLGQGRLISLDHLEEWADVTRRGVEARGLGGIATVLHAPLVERQVDGRAVRWYADGYRTRLAGPIELLIIDGPPGKDAPLARWPALGLLREHLAERCTIIMDDGDRPDETEIARLWGAALGVTPTYLPGAKGSWILQR